MKNIDGFYFESYQLYVPEEGHERHLKAKRLDGFEIFFTIDTTTQTWSIHPSPLVEYARIETYSYILGFSKEAFWDELRPELDATYKQMMTFLCH